MIIINIIDAPVGGISYCKIVINSVKSVVLQINPKKFKHIKNKTIPSPLRPKFRNKSESNIYFLSKRKYEGEKKALFIKRAKIFTLISVICIGSFILSN